MNTQNTRIFGILLVSMLCLILAASAAAAQPAPFVINGYVDSGGSPCNGPAVHITNTNTSASWDAENDSASNFYMLVLDSEDVSTGNILQIEASGCTKIKMVEHTVTQSEMEDGGISGFNIVFDATQEIIWQGDVTLTNGTTFDKTAHNSGISYEINRTTAIGALDAAAEEGVFNYTINDEWYASYGSLYVDSIADIPSEGYNGWMYWVNYPEDPMPMVGADQFLLEDGDVVTWYWSSSMDMTPANSSNLVNITVAIEEPQEIIWQGDVTLTNGTTFDKTAHNSGVSYEINQTTAIGALDAAAEEGVFNYAINDEWYASYGSLYVDSIADIPSEGYNGWMYWVNYPEDPMPMVGADQFLLEDGDVVTWYWSSSMDMTPANSSMLMEINATVTSSDITPPVISNVTNTDPTTNSVTISWDTDEDSDSVVRYGTTSGNYTNVESDTSPVRSHSISLTGLSASTTYYYVVNSTDASGNAGEGSEYSFTTAATSDITTILIADAIAAPNGYAFTSIMVNNVADLGSGNLNVTFDPSLIQVIDVTSGDGNALTVQDWNVDNTAGSLEIAAWDAGESHNGNVVFAHLTLHSIGDHLSSTSLAVSSAELINYDTYEPITHTVATGTLDTIAPIVIIGNVEAASGESTTALVMVNNASNLGSGSITVTYNTSVVHVTNVTSGDGNALAVQDWNADNTAGLLEIAAWDGNESHNGDVVFANVTFHVVGEYPDSTPLAISSSELIDYTSYGIIGHSVTNGTFSIIDNEPPVITDAIATLDVILNDNGRPRIPGTNVTVLNATVFNGGSGVAKVTIDLSPIGGSDNQIMERIAGTDVWTVATTATNGINLTHELVVTATEGADNTNTSVIELTILLRGDVVRDGDLNSADALYIAKYLVGKEPMPSLLVGDMSPDIGDGRVTSADALYLAKYLVGKEAAP